jgi:hypothetical protein
MQTGGHRQGDGSSVCVIEGRIEMIGHIISFVIGAAIVYFAARALFKTFKNAKEGRCSACSEDCRSCTFNNTLMGRDS